MAGARELDESVRRIAEKRGSALSASTDEATRRRLEDILRVVSDWVWEADREYRLTYVSPRFFDLLGQHPSAVEGKLFIELGSFVELADGQAETALRRAFRDVLFEMRDREGVVRAFRLSGLPVYDHETGALRGYRGAARDVTQRISDERDLRLAKENAELANRAKTEFLANMSHELRTPLNTIIGFADLIAREVYGPLGNEKYADYIRNISESGRHLLDLINDLLDVTAIETDRLELRPDAIATTELVRSSLSLMEGRAGVSEVAIVDSLPATLPMLYADPRRSKQVLLNILGNAVKFTPPGGRIVVSARRDPEGGLVITVADTGIGIHEADMPMIFSPFRQADHGHARRHEGTGLGLYLSRRIMELHGGTLAVASEVGKGTTVDIGFPASRLSDSGA